VVPDADIVSSSSSLESLLLENLGSFTDQVDAKDFLSFSGC